MDAADADATDAKLADDGADAVEAATDDVVAVTSTQQDAARTSIIRTNARWRRDTANGTQQRARAEPRPEPDAEADAVADVTSTAE